VSDTLRVAKTTVSEPNRESEQATEEAIKALQSQLADLRMLVRAIPRLQNRTLIELPDDRRPTPGPALKGE
jgi:hypothetical protein